jgi:plastocyanin
VTTKRRRTVLSAVGALFISVLLVAPAAAGASSSTYRVQLDARPPAGEPWSFLRYFPRELSVHPGDVVNAAWGGAGAPHTATAIPSGNIQAWVAENQGSGGPQDPSEFPWAFQVPDATVGGDDNEVVLNPAAAAPSDPSCGTSVDPCDFDGTSVVNSGLQFSSPGAQPSFNVHVTAPIGDYAFVCLVHPGMQMDLHVVGGGTTIPTPSEVATQVTAQIARAKTVDGPTADDLAQTVKRTHLPSGHTRLTMWAGGFWRQVSADEFPDDTLRAHVGDRLKVLGNFEIHTATFPASSARTVPFITTQCEVTGADTPATSPADCEAPTDFQIAFNTQALAPTPNAFLRDPRRFVNSGLITWPDSHVFVARQPGLYDFVCLVHGPSMSGSIRVARD